MLKKLSAMGLRSDHLYVAGFVSIAATFASWAASMAKPDDSKAQADRLGLFTGEWAPTFFALGVALKLEEDDQDPSL